MISTDIPRSGTLTSARSGRDTAVAAFGLTLVGVAALLVLSYPLLTAAVAAGALATTLLGRASRALAERRPRPSREATRTGDADPTPAIE